MAMVFPLVTLFHPAVVSSTPFLAEPPMFPAIGLILMMYPPLTKIDFSKIPLMFEKPKLLHRFFFIWIIGPFLMFSLATFFLKDSQNT
jgi:ACR3 family arsenite efflux pump ArsB